MLPDALQDRAPAPAVPGVDRVTACWVAALWSGMCTSTRAHWSSERPRVQVPVTR
ncbi:hypothetical protein [Nonomuraea sp. NPDC023979]|uniref:hypothetical protein n=1 Tax=Nonomuraea sp. NPDC023979 TaxID=3154796 RepID=UPI0033C3ED9D